MPFNCKEGESRLDSHLFLFTELLENYWKK